MNANRAIIEKLISEKFNNSIDLTKIKTWACREFNLKKFPRNSEIFASATEKEKEKLVQILKLKPVRSISGVYIVTVMTKPYACPKDEPCVYCPGGPGFGTPQSYTGYEPAGRRAKEHDFDPYKQVKSRIQQFSIMGHDIDKIELIIFGGTITAYPKEYLEWFVTQCLNAISGVNAKNIQDAQIAAENATIKNSDITIETRPDYCKKTHVDFMLNLGVTRIELGVQTVYDDIYKKINRGHTVEDVIEATRIAKDAGFAVIYHMMPGLPGVDFDKDLKAFEKIFKEENFKPDAIKIYPTLVLPETKLYQMWKKGEYKPYPLEKYIELIVKIKKQVPKWVRIQRIQRDISSNLIVDGIKRGDLRLLIQEKLKKENMKCQCIRCREVGHVQYKSNYEPDFSSIKLLVNRYAASDGEEIFISFEDIKQDILIGLLRLRYPSNKSYRSELKTNRSTLIREVHVYGPTVKVGKEAKNNQWQHKGLGERLIKEAERISKNNFDAKKIVILAGIGTRNYYRRFGYNKEGPYMVKRI
ncbi:MAG: tRNA uridine(34) 5-carboxymethylaminomethyl modification radical SAM/GNAT enzyme Elp3 [Thermoplasmatota archaeon]|jgi:elongator complex protein 3